MAQQQKVLYVVFSVIVTLAIVCVVAVVFLLPPQEVTIEDETPEDAAIAKTETYDPSTWVQNGETVPEFQAEEHTEDGIIVIGVADEEDVPKESVGVENAGTETVKPKEESTVVSVPSARDIETPAAPKRTATTVSRSSSVQERSAPAKRSVRAIEYWIQAGSFTSRSRAEISQAELKKNGFSCLITSKAVGGVNYYRLRLGPYEDKNEAEKFLGWIRGLDKYNQSYISEVYVQKTI